MYSSTFSPDSTPQIFTKSQYNSLPNRDKFLSPDQGMCNQTQGGVNEYQLTEKAKKEHIPNSSMSSPNIASIHSLNSQKAVRIGS